LCDFVAYRILGGKWLNTINGENKEGLRCCRSREEVSQVSGREPVKRRSWWIVVEAEDAKWDLRRSIYYSKQSKGDLGLSGFGERISISDPGRVK